MRRCHVYAGLDRRLFVVYNTTASLDMSMPTEALHITIKEHVRLRSDRELGKLTITPMQLWAELPHDGTALSMHSYG